MSDTTQIFSDLALWMIVPPILASTVLSIFHRIYYRSPTARPAKKTPRFVSQYRRAYLLVIFLYFVYTIYSHLHQLRPNFYEELGVSRSNLEQELKPRYRTLLRMYHPDKAGPEHLNAPDGDGTAFFVRIKNMYETLGDNTAREAYEKFKKSKVTATANKSRATTFREGLYDWLPEWLGFYLVSFVILLIMGISGRLGYAGYWRFILLAGLALFEWNRYLTPLTEPSPSIVWTALDYLLPNRTINEKVPLLRHGFVFLSVVLGQLGSTASSVTIKALTDRLSTMMSILVRDSNSQAKSALDPFRKEAELVETLKRRMGKLAVETQFFETNADYRRAFTNATNRTPLQESK